MIKNYILLSILFFSGILTRAHSTIDYKMTAIFDSDAIVTKYAVLYIYETRKFQLKEIKNRTFSFIGTLQLKSDFGYGNGLIILTNKADYNSMDIKQDLLAENSIHCIIENNFNLTINKRYARSVSYGKQNDVFMQFSKIDWMYDDIWKNQLKKVDSIRKSITRKSPEKLNLERENEAKQVLSGLVLKDNPTKLKDVYNVIINNTTSTVAFSKLYVLGRSKHFPIDEISVAYNRFSDELRNSVKGKMIDSIIRVNTDIAKDDLLIGAQATLFKLLNERQQSISLNDYKGKYILIEFWASWCGPCRTEMPTLKAVKENNKNLIVITISTDKNRENWLKAIKADGISSFVNLIDNNSAIAKQYGVRLIPQNFLINKEGIIVAKNLYHDELKENIGKLLN